MIQDILPLYIDDVVSDDTKELVEEHLQNCEICQRVYHETKTDLENDMKISAQTKESSNEANDLKNFRKFLKKRKIKTILLSIAATIVCFVAVFTFMNKHVTYISYKDAGITIVEDNKDEVTYRTNIKGNYRWSTSLDRKTGVMTIHFEQSLWEKYVSLSLIHISQLMMLQKIIKNLLAGANFLCFVCHICYSAVPIS